MRSEEHNSKQPTRLASKVILLCLAFALVLGTAIGGTVAWLMAETKPVTNTFTFGDINIDLIETGTGLDDDSDPTTNTYKMFPAESTPKDPQVIVKADSEACWLFVKIETSDNFDTFLSYELDDGWAQLVDEEDNIVPGVYYRTVDADRNSLDKTINVLKGDDSVAGGENGVVTVHPEVTKEMLEELGDSGEYPTMTITAYAVQWDENIEAIDSAYEAWCLVLEDGEGA